MSLRMIFGNFGCICYPVPGLLVSLDIDVELGQKVLDITLVLDGQKSRLEVLSEGHILASISFDWLFSDSSAA